MPWAARAGVDPRRGSFFVHNNMGNLLLGRDDTPAAKTEFRAIWRNRSSQTCSGDSGLYGWSYLLWSRQAYI